MKFRVALLACASLVAGAASAAMGKVFGRTPGLTPYAVKSLKPLWPCDCTAAHTQLGWKPRYTAPEGLSITFPAAKRA